MRDLNREFQDNAHRQYAYNFDYHMHDFMLRVFEPHLLPGRALELGCYHGAFTERLARIFSDLTVVEGASELVDIARARVGNGVRFVLSRFEDFAPQERFDAAFLLHTLEHLDEPVSLLGRIRSWLAPRGRLFVAVPNAYAASRQIAVAMGLISHPTAVTAGEALHGHRRTYCLETLQSEIAAAGLQILDTGGVVFKPLANFQFDRVLKHGIVGDDYLNGCYELGKRYPELCASIYVICGAPDHRE
jgi:2-polyprenyl-3-methyl-5-hydroxy-6-metoxy-1,4-benzoquinol methylase